MRQNALQKAHNPDYFRATSLESENHFPGQSVPSPEPHRLFELKGEPWNWPSSLLWVSLCLPPSLRLWHPRNEDHLAGRRAEGISDPQDLCGQGDRPDVRPGQWDAFGQRGKGASSSLSWAQRWLSRGVAERVGERTGEKRSGRDARSSPAFVLLGMAVQVLLTPASLFPPGSVCPHSQHVCFPPQQVPVALWWYL